MGGAVSGRPGAPLARFSRRDFLALGLGGAVVSFLSACRADELARTTPAPQVADDADTVKKPFYIAHRGSGDNWVEHTLAAYLAAAATGVTAIEISVSSTRDGVLVCHHDEDLQRLTGSPALISDIDWADLDRLRNDARAWLGPNSALEPVPRLADVLSLLDPSITLYVEDKQGTNTTALLDLLDENSGPDRFVWKQWAGAAQYAAAQARGYRRWGYFDSTVLDRLDDWGPRFDMLGLPVKTSDEDFARFVATGLPVIAWEVHRRSERDRLAALGVSGMMCSNIPYVTAAGPSTMADRFSSGVRASGDLPWSTVGWSAQPAIVADEGLLRIESDEVSSYLMGSLSPIGADRYSISLELRWPEALPASDQHVGIAFGQSTDAPYRVGVEGGPAGHHLVLGADGSLALYRRGAGTAKGELLGRGKGTPPAAGRWIKISVAVTSDGIVASRSGGSDVESVEILSGGGYVSLLKNYSGGPAVEFRSIAVATSEPEPAN